VLQGKKLENVKDAGVSQSAALHHARDALQCGEFNMGLYQHSLLLTLCSKVSISLAVSNKLC